MTNRAGPAGSLREPRALCLPRRPKPVRTDVLQFEFERWSATRLAISTTQAAILRRLRSLSRNVANSASLLRVCDCRGVPASRARLRRTATFVKRAGTEPSPRTSKPTKAPSACPLDVPGAARSSPQDHSSALPRASKASRKPLKETGTAMSWPEESLNVALPTPSVARSFLTMSSFRSNSTKQPAGTQ